LRAALLGPTVGQTRRGYERFLTDLHRTLRHQSGIEAILFKGVGEAGPGEVVVPHVTRTGWLARAAGQRLRYPRYLLEHLTFAFAVTGALRRGGFDLVHYVDPPLGPLLKATRALTGAPFRMLFTNAGPHPHDASHEADHLHCLTPRARDEARACGVAEERLSMIPVGVDTARFRRSASRKALRHRLGLPSDVFVVLSVGTLNRHHKRTDYVIEEVARMSRRILLWLDGGFHPDGDRTLVDLGQRLLGERFRHSHMESGRVAELYSAADVFVSAALEESFGIAVVEAMANGLPVVTHDSPHFRWLTADAAHRADLSVPGRLTSLLTRIMEDPLPPAGPGPASSAARFDWHALTPAYVKMYEAAAIGTRAPAVASDERTCNLLDGHTR
jgi:glycosyltransferase involved in cell wall biosynthesis